MKKINLRALFPECELDCYIEVPEADVDAYIAALTKDIVNIYIKAQREKNASKRYMFWHQAHYSLDAGDGIEDEAGYTSPPPHEVLERDLIRKQIYDALDRLPDKQRERIFAHFFLGMSKAEIARVEGVNKSQITRSINRALSLMKKSLRNFEKGGQLLP